MRPRTVLGLALALTAIVLAAPPAISPLPGSHALHQLAQRTWLGWLAVPALVSLALVVAAWCLPPPSPSRPGERPRPNLAPVGVGALFIIEPALHLLLLWWLGTHSPSDPSAVALPMGSGLDDGSFVWRVAALSLLVPLAEEFFFRGRLLPLIRDRLGAMSAVTLSTLAFACAHGDAGQMMVALPLGVLLGLLRLHGRDLGACVLVHQMHNGLLLLAGPAVVSAPWVAALLIPAGVALFAFGLAWQLRATVRRTRILVWCLCAVAAIGAVYPAYAAFQDRLWVGAAHRAIVSSRESDDRLVQRLDWQRRRGRLAGGRGDILAEALVAHPCARRERQVLALALIAPGRVVAPTVDEGGGPADDDADAEAYDALTDIARCPVDSPALDEGARRIGLLHPEAFARHAVDHPEHVARWLVLPARRAQAAAHIAASVGGQRRRLLTMLERHFPGQIAEVLFLLPADQVTALDRRHLRAHYGNALARLLADLAVRDRRLAHAFAE